MSYYFALEPEFYVSAWFGMTINFLTSFKNEPFENMLRLTCSHSRESAGPAVLLTLVAKTRLLASKIGPTYSAHLHTQNTPIFFIFLYIY